VEMSQYPNYLKMNKLHQMRNNKRTQTRIYTLYNIYI